MSRGWIFTAAEVNSGNNGDGQYVNQLHGYIIAFFQLLTMAHKDLARGPWLEDMSEKTFKFSFIIQQYDWEASPKSSPQSYRLPITLFRNGRNTFITQDTPIAKKALRRSIL